ncbi:hypothetical protein MKEN_00551400 [Mycena kentingensis (nom. inval.)]|nr:hypothetical protein MKEN_00551400 [Mycena kentingensis (nom. inval.)]
MPLPAELCDAVLDYLHADPETLRSTALVCRSWVRTSRLHSFSSLSLSLSNPPAASFSATPRPHTPETAAFRAIALDGLLASPLETISPSIHSLEVRDTLAPVRLRWGDRPVMTAMATLLQLVPRLAFLPSVKTLRLSELCWPLLRSLGGRVAHLYLATGAVCLGGNLPKLLAALPRLQTLELDGVAGIPLRFWSPKLSAPAQSFVSPLHTLTIRHSSIAFLPWLSNAVAPNLSTLKIDGLVSYELEYLETYLLAPRVGATLRVLELAFLSQHVDAEELEPILEPCSALQTLIVRGEELTLPNASTEKSMLVPSVKTAAINW